MEWIERSYFMDEFMNWTYNPGMEINILQVDDCG